MLPELTAWKSMSDAERIEVAHWLTGSLAIPFEFRGITEYACGEQNNRMAVFRSDDADFVLLPGATVDLGYLWKRPFELTSVEKESWEGTAEEYGITTSFDDYLAEYLSQPRKVTIAPFLLEITARELGKERLPGPREAYSVKPVSHSSAKAKVESEGFALPSSDQWEYACGAGSTTLFRWGDHCPADHYPTDELNWSQHNQPNAFGIHIAQNPYDWEFVAEPEVLRGGDGGGTICGGAGFLVGWLPLATAYVERAQQSCDEPIFGPNLRRAVPLACVQANGE